MPFSRVSLTTSYSYIVPTGYNEGTGNSLFGNSLFYVLGTDGKFRDGQAVVWGNVADGMLKYHIAYGNGVLGGSAPYNAIGARIQFTPTMLGFKPEKGYVLKDSYLGKKNVLSIGIGYQSETLKDTTNDEKVQRTGLAADIFWEQNFGAVVPGLQIGYINWKEGNNDPETLIYAQGSIVSGQKIGLGQIGLSVKYVNEEVPGQNNQTETNNWVDIYLGYYLAGHKAVIYVGVDNVSTSEENEDPKPTLYFRSMF